MPTEEPNFLVNPYNEPVVVRIIGKATFQNCSPLRDFFNQMAERDKRSFVIDFQKCKGMDSTFLGILAGVGIQMMKLSPPGTVVLSRLGPRNLELVHNLGLHRIMTVDSGDSVSDANLDDAESFPATEGQLSEIENARMVLQAHENLVEIDDSNKTKFQDVISFLKNQVEEN